MNGQWGQNKILSLRRRWKWSGIVFCALLALAVSLPVTTVLYSILDAPIWLAIPVFGIGMVAFLFLFPYWRIQPMDTARYLDRNLPELEESSWLLLQPENGLGALQRLQVTRTAKRLADITTPRPFHKKLLWAIGGVLLGILLSYGILIWAFHGLFDTFFIGQTTTDVMPTAKALPGIRTVTIIITPPAYTAHPPRTQTTFNLRAEAGSDIRWNLWTGDSVRSVALLWDDSVQLDLHPVDPQRTEWTTEVTPPRSGFYQVKLDGRLSELYSFEQIKDEPPVISILTPKPYTVVDYGEPTKIPLSVLLRDDYGIKDATIVGTVASGSGEAVKFKEQTLRFNNSFTDALSEYHLSQSLDLDALGLRPGDELYFYCRAKDNHGQESRTDMYIISLPDTAQLMSLQGLTMGVDIKPEYFRSERQIIIETEQLLKDKDSITAEAFHDRSNNLGIDQKLLRLRYGKFLGEEAEEGEANGGSSPSSAEGKPAASGDINRRENALRANDFGDLNKIRDAFTDKHDNAEDATYFEPAVKEQLKATLSEMWKAELQLRTYQPRQALPFAYKALRLLKDLQQKSRAYVAKTGVRTTPLDPAKRLTGKLDGITPRVQYAAAKESPPSPETVLRVTLGLLEHLQSRVAGPIALPPNAPQPADFTKSSLEILQEATRRLAHEASGSPATFLPGYQSMRRIMGILLAPSQEIQDSWHSADILSAQSAIRRLLPEAGSTPSTRLSSGESALSDLYFHQINAGSGKP
ncbi:MAG TPA: DUF4175 family protein [Puia sp.]|jgi:hypothetical protein|nr:DUF4175 family protein [Puia sp.]